MSSFAVTPAEVYAQESGRFQTHGGTARKGVGWSYWLCTQNPAQSPHKDTDALCRARRGALGERDSSAGPAFCSLSDEARLGYGAACPKRVFARCRVPNYGTCRLCLRRPRSSVQETTRPTRALTSTWPIVEIAPRGQARSCLVLGGL